MKIVWWLLSGVLVFSMFWAVSAQAVPILGVFQGSEYEVFNSPGVPPAMVFGSVSLAVITSAEEQLWLEVRLNDMGIVGEYWIGGFQPPGETNPSANWQWITGEPWVYTNWYSGEPNDYYGIASEQYLAMWSDLDWGWNDENNHSNTAGFITKEPVEPIPEPGTLLLLGIGLAGMAGRVRFRRKKHRT